MVPPNVGGAGVKIEDIRIDQPIETVSSRIMIVPDMTYVSQLYHQNHAAIDLAAPLGSVVYPFRDGEISRVEHLKYGYGRVIYMKHDDDMESIYAHMGKIFVNEGDVVTTKDAIGEIGLTGRTTGAHLHLEIIKNGVRVNPRQFIEVKDQRRR
jgi:murein DD-endopeptidase MepM/ murein hydrolase activator NlpD